MGEREAAREQVTAAAKELQAHTSHLQEEDSRLKAALATLTAVRDCCLVRCMNVLACGRWNVVYNECVVWM